MLTCHGGTLPGSDADALPASAGRTGTLVPLRGTPHLRRLDKSPFGMMCGMAWYEERIEIPGVGPLQLFQVKWSLLS
jgi:hypothetical protein